MDISSDFSRQQGNNFVFPQRNIQLCDQPADPNQFYVTDRIDVARWSEEKLQEEIGQIIDKIGNKRCLQIVSNENFDTLYSILYKLDEISLSAKKEVIQILEQGLRSLLKFMDNSKILDWAEQNFIGSD